MRLRFSVYRPGESEGTEERTGVRGDPGGSVGTGRYVSPQVEDDWKDRGEVVE